MTQPIPGGFPLNKRLEGSLQARLTPEGLTFVQDNFKGILQKVLQGPLAFEVPPQTSSPKICASGKKCYVGIEIDRLQLTPTPPNKLGVTILGKVSSLGPSTKSCSQNSQCGSRGICSAQKKCLVPAPFPAEMAVMSTTVQCKIDIHSNKTPVQADLELGTDPQSKTLTFSLKNPRFQIRSGDLSVAPGRPNNPDDKAFCKGADLFKLQLISMFTQPLISRLNELLGELQCKKCKGNSDCPSGNRCETKKGLCYRPGSKSCTKDPIALEGMFNLGSLLGPLSRGRALNFKYYVAPGQTKASSSALDLGIWGGALADHHSCGPPVTPPPIKAVTPLSFPRRIPATGRPYMAGIALSQEFLRQAMHAVYQSGILCLDVDSSVSDLLKVAAIGVLAPSLAELIGNPDAPLRIKTSPSGPPTINIGENVSRTLPDGKVELVKPLLEIVLKDFHLDFYSVLHDRYVRLLTLTLDLVVPLTLQPTSGNQLLPVLGDLSKAAANVRAENNNLAAESSQKIASSLTPLLNTLVLPLIVKEIKAFTIPDFSGFRIKVKHLAGEEKRTDNPSFYRYLVVYADLQLLP